MHLPRPQRAHAHQPRRSADRRAVVQRASRRWRPGHSPAHARPDCMSIRRRPRDERPVAQRPVALAGGTLSNESRDEHRPSSQIAAQQPAGPDHRPAGRGGRLHDRSVASQGGCSGPASGRAEQRALRWRASRGRTSSRDHARPSRPAGSRNAATTVATDKTWARHHQVPGPRLAVTLWQAWPAVAQAAWTWVACGPFGPWTTSNSTCWFSSRLRKP
jgi:hypothetical protein